MFLDLIYSSQKYLEDPSLTMDMVSFSPLSKWGCGTPSKWPCFGLINGGDSFL